MATRHGGTRRKLDAKVAELGLLDLPTRPHAPVAEADLALLPAPAARWLRRAGVVGAIPVRSFRAGFEGEMRTKPGQGWMPLSAWQLNTVDPIARVFQMRVDAAHVIPMLGIDSYVDHTGYMRGRVLGLVTVAEGRGREFDLGELVTWVNDAVMLAPSMLLGEHVTWRAVDEHSFELTVVDGDNTVAAQVTVDADGMVADFVTQDRWYAGTDPPSRARWHTPLSGWVSHHGRWFPGHGEAVWSFEEGDFAYVRGRFDPDTVEFDITS